MTNVVDTLARMVASPTVSSQPLTELAAFVAERCTSAGFRVEQFPSPGEGKLNLVCSRGPAGTDGLVLSGHMDVVPVEGQPWTSDPFRLTPRGSRLVGRGTADMKGFIAATLHAIEALPVLERELVLVWTCDEEVGCLGSRSLVQDLAGRALPTACLIGEPTSFRILRMHPGHTAVRVVTTGRAAHSSKPDLGDNAIRKAGRVLERLDVLAEEWRRDVRFADLLERPFVVMNVATIRGGVAVNIVPDRCTLDVGFRALPGMDEGALIAAMQDRLEGLATVEAVRSTPALLTAAGTPLERLLAPHSGGRAPGAASFATDGGNLHQLGMAPLVFGPGSIDVAHMADEWVDEGELFRTIPILESIIAQRCC
jgi:acetylornithine deacetylase